MSQRKADRPLQQSTSDDENESMNDVMNEVTVLLRVNVDEYLIFNI